MEHKKTVVDVHGDYARTFSSEDGKHYRGLHQNMKGVLKHAEIQRHKNEHRTKKDTLFEKHVLSLSPAMLMDWLNERGFTLQQWAVNAGGDPYKKTPDGPGVYDQCLKHFMGRDYSKLNNFHHLNKQGSSQILVPDTYRSKPDGDHQSE